MDWELHPQQAVAKTLGAGFKGDIFYSYRGQSTKMPFNDTSSETWRKPDFTGDIFHSCYCVKSTEMVV